MNIPFLSLKDVTALHGAEINEAVSRVVNGGWYLQGKGRTGGTGTCFTNNRSQQ